jgi:hypothetical protein
MDTPALQNAEERGKRWLLTACSESSDSLQVQRSMCCQPTGYLHNGSIPTVCPSNDSARLLSYQSLPTSSELWRGHGQEAKRGEVGGPRSTRHVK